MTRDGHIDFIPDTRFGYFMTNIRPDLLYCIFIIVKAKMNGTSSHQSSFVKHVCMHTRISMCRLYNETNEYKMMQVKSRLASV